MEGEGGQKLEKSCLRSLWMPPDFVKVWKEVEMSHFLRLDAYSCYQVRKNKKWVIYGFLLQQTYMLHKQYMYNVLRKTPVQDKLNLLLHWKFFVDIPAKFFLKK